MIDASIGTLKHRLSEHYSLDQLAVQAWFGPAIGPSAFEVGEEVKQAFANTSLSKPIRMSNRHAGAQASCGGRGVFIQSSEGTRSEPVATSWAELAQMSHKHFVASPSGEGRWIADLAGLAADRLGYATRRFAQCNIALSDECTYQQASTYFSYRREGQTGRMASVICF